jgi:hypothetical protein
MGEPIEVTVPDISPSSPRKEKRDKQKSQESFFPGYELFKAPGGSAVKGKTRTDKQKKEKVSKNGAGIEEGEGSSASGDREPSGESEPSAEATDAGKDSTSTGSETGDLDSASDTVAGGTTAAGKKEEKKETANEEGKPSEVEISTVQFVDEKWEPYASMNYTLGEKSNYTDNDGFVKDNPTGVSDPVIRLVTVRTADKAGSGSGTGQARDETLSKKYEEFTWTVCDKAFGGKGPIRLGDKRADEVTLASRMFDIIGITIPSGEGSSGGSKQGVFDTRMDECLTLFQDIWPVDYAGIRKKRESLKMDSLLGPRTILSLGCEMVRWGVIPFYWYFLSEGEGENEERTLVYVTLLQTVVNDGADVAKILATGQKTPRLLIPKTGENAFDTPRMDTKDAKPKHLIIRMLGMLQKECWEYTVRQKNMIGFGWWPGPDGMEFVKDGKTANMRGGLIVTWQLVLKIFIDKMRIIVIGIPSFLEFEPYSYPTGVYHSHVIFSSVAGSGSDQEGEWKDQAPHAARFDPATIQDEDIKLKNEWLKIKNHMLPLLWLDTFVTKGQIIDDRTIEIEFPNPDSSKGIKKGQGMGWTAGYFCKLDETEASERVGHWEENKNHKKFTIIDYDRYFYKRSEKVVLIETETRDSHFRTSWSSGSGSFDQIGQAWRRSSEGLNYENTETVMMKRINCYTELP